VASRLLGAGLGVAAFDVNAGKTARPAGAGVTAAAPAAALAA
jgi:3-hydroxyisobutyrate dehydrogenase-like beta-hydroxyacid dehydrogenase